MKYDTGRNTGYNDRFVFIDIIQRDIFQNREMPGMC